MTFAAAPAVNGGSLLRFFVLDAELHAAAVVVARDSWSQPSSSRVDPSTLRNRSYGGHYCLYWSLSLSPYLSSTVKTMTTADSLLQPTNLDPRQPRARSYTDKLVKLPVPALAPQNEALHLVSYCEVYWEMIIIVSFIFKQHGV